MPYSLTALDPMDSRSLSTQLADQLRDLITSGEIPPGEPLPAQSELKATLDVSDNTVRAAMAQLRSEGLIDAHRGKGVFVRQPQVVRHVSSTRYSKQRDGQHNTSAFTSDLGVMWDQYSVESTFRQVKAPALVSELLQLGDEELVLERFSVMRAGNIAQQVRSSYFPLSLVKGTPMMDPNRQPVPGGVIAELEALGLVVTTIDEEVQARMPTPTEAHLLRIPAGVPVLAVTRVGWAGERPVELVSEMVLPADRIRLHYRIELQPTR